MGSGSRWNVLIMTYLVSHCFMWEYVCNLHRDEVSAKELILLVLEKTLESSLDCKEIKPVNPKGNQSWIFIAKTHDEAETPILWTPDMKNWLTGKKPWCWERLRAGGEAGDRGWDDWMAPPTQQTWVWASSESWCWIGKFGMLQSMVSQKVWHDWATELNWFLPPLMSAKFWVPC